MDLLSPGQQLGRYTIGELRGVGSMGLVYAAHDTELGRSVALKLLRLEAADDAGDVARARLMREAQALARLSHPHVVAIYDVGIHDERVFAAMELVEGAALDEWLHARRRTATEVIEVMSGAGRGLAAAHAAGLIHRDVKPENILVGADGRARVSDFGLVRIAAAPDASRASSGSDDAGAAPPGHLTRTGALLGTPAYMSPEQLCAQPIGPATDQFSFAVTLYEALYGERPFRGGNLRELRERVVAGTLAVPRRGFAVPSRVRRALRRALQVDQRRRFPSMDALLAELDDGRRGRYRRMRIASGAVGAIAIAAIAALLIGGRMGGEPPCTGAAGHLAGVWDPARRLAVERAFAAHDGPLARDAFDRVARGLDAYSAAWVAMHTDTCEASAVRGEQPADVLALRMACLGKDLELTRQVVELFTSPEFRNIGQAAAAVDALPRLADCADIAALKAAAPLPGDPGLRLRLGVLDVRVAELRARWLVDDQASVRQGAPALVAEARSIGYAPVTAAVLLLAGEAEATFGDLRAAEDKLYQGLWSAEAAQDAEQVARAWIAIVRIVGHEQRRFAEGDRLLRNAEHAVERAAAISPSAASALRIRLLANASALVFAEGDIKAAIARAGEALALETRRFGADTAAAAQLHHSLAVFKVTGADPSGAWSEIQSALAIAERRLGIGPRLVSFRDVAGGILLAQGKFDEAIAEFDRAIAIASQVYTTDNKEVAIALNSQAMAYQAKGDLDHAHSLLERGLAILVATRGPDSAEVSATLDRLGNLAAQAGRLSAAQSYFERALAISERVDGLTHYHTSERLISLGTVLIDQGHPRQALPYLERGLRILEDRRASGAGVYPNVLAGARFMVAQALWSSPGERARARALATSAGALLDASSGDLRTRAIVRDLARWLATHPR